MASSSLGSTRLSTVLNEFWNRQQLEPKTPDRQPRNATWLPPHLWENAADCMAENNRVIEPAGAAHRPSLIHIGSQCVRLIRLDTLDPSFVSEFAEFKAGFLRVLSHSYVSYYGDDYHVKRIVEGKSILFFAQAEQETVGVSYVKRNRRRGGTAVFPETYRRHGLAEALVRASFLDFPDQYSLLGVANTDMMRLLHKVGFVRANSIEGVRNATQDEFQHLSDFTTSSDGITFKRFSETRNTNRETLTLFCRSAHADTR